MPYKDLEKRKAYQNEYMKRYRVKNKEKIKEQVENNREKNKEKIKAYQKAYDKAYNQTDRGIKSRRIKNWKSVGIIFDDFEWLYDLYISRHTCDHCDKEFINDKERCLDHDHDIDDYNNVRGILCRQCNFKDVLKSK